MDTFIISAFTNKHAHCILFAHTPMEIGHILWSPSPHHRKVSRNVVQVHYVSGFIGNKTNV